MIAFEDLDSPNMVYTANFTAPIPNRHTIYCGIPCTVQSEYEDGDVVSVRWNGLYKGVKGGYFPNTMIIDFWLEGKCRYTRVNRTGSIQMCEVPNKEMALKLVANVAAILTNANRYVNNVVDSVEFKEATDWLIDNSVGEEFGCVSTFKLKNDPNLGKMEFCKIVPEKSIAWPEVIPRKYRRLLNEFKNVSDDLLCNNNACHLALVARVNTLITATPCDDVYIVDSIKVCNAMYMYHLGYVANRYEFADVLEELGYDVHYPSTSSSEVIVYLTIDDIKATFLFYPKGSVGLSCTVIKKARLAYNKLMTDVHANRHRFELKV